MTNIHRLRTRQEREDEAARWVARLDRGLTVDERAELKQWLSADAANADTLNEMATLWGKMNSLALLAELFPRRPVWRSQGVVAVAASVLFGIGVVLTFLLDRSPAETVATPAASYETPVGNHSRIELNDGSVVTLNSNSAINVVIDDHQRVVELAHGEIHVDVAHDEDRHFEVRAAHRTLRALGTAFNVRMHTDSRIEVLVTEGRVLIGNRDTGTGRTSVPSFSVAASETVILGHGRDETDRESIQQLDPEEIEIRLSWRNGNLIFRGEPLQQAAAEVSRYTNLHFVFLDDDTRKIRVAGLFRAGDVDGFLSSLQTNFDISYERVDNQTIHLGQAKVDRR